MSHQPQTDGLGKAARNKIKNISGHQVQQLLQKLKIIQPFLPPIQYQELISTQDFQKGEADLTKENSGGKHVLQEVSIIGHLRRINALRDATRAIELGAGTARLSDRLQKVTCGKLDHTAATPNPNRFWKYSPCRSFPPADQRGAGHRSGHRVTSVTAPVRRAFGESTYW